MGPGRPRLAFAAGLTGRRRKPVQRAAGVALLLLLLAACAPNVVGYYRPEMPGATTLRGGCGVKVDDALRIDVAGVQILLQYLDAAGQRRAGLYAHVQVPAHRRFAFDSELFLLREEAAGRALAVRGVQVLRDDAQTTLTAPYDAGDVGIDDPGRANKRWYHLTVYTDEISVPAFTLQLPAVTVDGVRSVLPPVQFRRTTALGIGPLNC